MITLRKLATLAEGTRQRKCLVLVRDLERLLAGSSDVDRSYLRGLLNLVAGDSYWSETLRKQAGNHAAEVPDGIVRREDLRRRINRLGHDMAHELGQDWADWDAVMPGDATDGGYTPIRPFRIYLDGLRSPFNIGSIMRTSMAFGVERLWASPDCSPPDHRRSVRSSMGATDHLPWRVEEFEALDPGDTGTVFALELGGVPVQDFRFPESGTVILGSEELGVRPGLLDLARRDGGVVSLPLPGYKASLNVGVAFGILLERWSSHS